MWRCQGKPLKIKNSILGRVTRKMQPLLSRHKYILISDNPTKYQNWNYAGLLSDETHVGVDSIKTCMLSKSNLTVLKEGDILLLEPSGLVTALMERFSTKSA
jgi:hypothetical protein